MARRRGASGERRKAEANGDYGKALSKTVHSEHYSSPRDFR
jgi:hypothetical protein